MKNTTALLVSVLVLFVAVSAHAYTVTVKNDSSHRIIVTVAAYYLVTSQDHLTIPVEPHETQTGNMGGLLSSGWRVVADNCGKEKNLCYNPDSFSISGTFARGDFTIHVYDGYSACILTSWSAGANFNDTDPVCK